MAPYPQFVIPTPGARGTTDLVEREPRAVELVAALRRATPDLYIQVDGHAAGHEQELAQAGANRLVEGSAILAADNPQAALKEAYNRANGAH